MPKKLTRTLEFTLKFSNPGKLKELEEFAEEYLALVNFFLEEFILGFSFNYQALKQVSFLSSLNIPQTEQAYWQAKQIFKRWKRTKRKGAPPQLKKKVLELSQLLVRIGKSKNTFDLWLNIALTHKGRRTAYPIKLYKYAIEEYLNKGWNLKKGVRLIRKENQWYACLYFEKEVEEPTIAEPIMAVDIGYRKLLTDSEGKVYGEKMKELTEKASRRQQGSKRWNKTRKEIRDYIGMIINQFFKENKEVKTVVCENLKNLKKEKKGKWSKKVNRRFNLWLYGLTLFRLSTRAEQENVSLVKVNPSYTSQRCPVCGHTEKENRKAERFKCLQCGYEGDADHVGALNILSRFYEESEVPHVGKIRGG